MTASIAVLTQLRERWQDSVDMLTSMFDLVIVPSEAGGVQGVRSVTFPGTLAPAKRRPVELLG